MLHALGVVDFSANAPRDILHRKLLKAGRVRFKSGERDEDRPAACRVFGEDADGLVEAGGDKLPSGGRVVDVQHGGDMVHVHFDGILQMPHVVCVQASESTGSNANVSVCISGTNQDVQAKFELLV